jgi:uncharacterized protein YukJ
VCECNNQTAINRQAINGPRGKWGSQRARKTAPSTRSKTAPVWSRCERAELRLRDRELRSSAWRNPLFLGIAAAVLTLLSNIYLSFQQHRHQTIAAKQEFQSNLILEVIKTGNPEEAAQNLRFLLDARLISDDGSKIRDSLAKQRPVLPSPQTIVSQRKGGLSNYGVLKGEPVEVRLQGERYHILVKTDEGNYRVSLNVESGAPPQELRFFLDLNFSHEIIRRLPDLPSGFTQLASTGGGLALDYLRAGVITDVTLLKPTKKDIIIKALDDHVRSVVCRSDCDIYVYGERFSEPGRPPNPRPIDRELRTLQGVHNVHMNQGNMPPFTIDNAVWQDGALIIHNKNEGKWIAVFFAHLNQSFETDDLTGHARTR